MERLVLLPKKKLKLSLELRFYDSSEGLVYMEAKEAESSVFHPTNLESLRTSLEILSNNANDRQITKLSSIIPKNILYIDFITMNEFIWITPRKVRNIIIKAKNAKIDGTFKIMIPMTVFHVKKNNLYIYFTNRDLRENTILYPTPFMNVDDTCGVCTGNYDLIKSTQKFKTLNDFMQNWEGIFFNSPFSHMNRSKWIFKKSFKQKTFYNAWKHFTKKKVISLRSIKTNGLTIKELIK